MLPSKATDLKVYSRSPVGTTGWLCPTQYMARVYLLYLILNTQVQYNKGHITSKKEK